MPNEDNTTPQSKTGDNNPTVGSKLGDFEIRDRLGTGAMGEVFLAVDSKLGREVALKVLSPSLPYGGDYLKRFENEAKLLASLSHPNVAHLHDFQEQDGAHFLVMELARGESLDRIIKRGPLNPREAIPIFIQVAQALEAAHEVNIIHRDLKPENIMVDRNGTVKVLDFGLAKHVPSAPWSVSEAHKRSGAELNDITTPGMIIGTPSYMSPEQARGNEIDTRTDIWAFGCCFYQALTGKPPFRAANMSDTLANVLTQDPDWGELPASTPIEVERLLRRCLEKELKNRLRHIGDGLHDLQVAQSRQSRAILNPFSWYRRFHASGYLFAIATTVIVCTTIIAAAFIWRDPPPSTAPVSKFTVQMPKGTTLDASARALAISPDGGWIAFVAGNNSSLQLYLRGIGDEMPRVISRTEGADLPFFSPDGEWIGFFAENSLKKISVRSGTPITLVRGIPSYWGGSWGQNGEIVYCGESKGGLSLIDSSGDVRTLTTPDPENGELGHWWPRFLPDGKTLLFTSFRHDHDTPSLEVIPVDQPEARKVVLRGVADARYVASGHLVYAQDSTLFAVPFDLDTLNTGEPVAVAHRILMDVPVRHGVFDVSENGTLIFAPSLTGPPLSRMVLVDRRSETVEHVDLPAADYAYPRFSWDGKQVAMTVAESNERQVVVADLARNTIEPVTYSKYSKSNFYPIWYTQPGHILYCSDFAGHDSLVESIVGSDREPKLLLPGEDASLLLGSYSRQTNLLAYMRQSSKMREDIYIYDHKSKPRPVVQSTFREGSPALSPSGEWLAYISNKSETWNVYVKKLIDSSASILVTPNGGTEPVWSRDGRELFFRNGDGLYSASFADNSPSDEEPEFVLKAPYRYEWKLTPNYDVSESHFVFMEDVEPPANYLSITLNWLSTLQVDPSQPGVTP